MLDLNNLYVLSGICGFISSVLTYAYKTKRDPEKKVEYLDLFFNFLLVSCIVYAVLVYKGVKGSALKTQKGGDFHAELPSTYSNNVQITEPNF